jgi:DNA-binding NarL/FixJ family response regulator
MPAEPTRRDRVLVVDDTPDTLALLTDALEEAGMTVLVALDGHSALERAQHAAPDIILLDAVMPGLDGFETCQRLKGLPVIANTPVVFMTGLSETEHVVKGFQAGGVDYVTKPIVPDELIARIRVHLANARLVSSAREALDRAGRALFSLSADGQVGWQTPEAARALEPLRDTPGMPIRLLDTIRGQLLAGMQEATAGGRRSSPVEVQAGGCRLLLTLIGRTGRDEVLIGVERTDSTAPEARLRNRFGLTTRECQVLVWIARGKSNRDIGEILELSPRTVNKHLERIYVKLGVENRASAAAVAIGVVSERG